MLPESKLFVQRGRCEGAQGSAEAGRREQDLSKPHVSSELEGGKSAVQTPIEVMWGRKTRGKVCPVTKSPRYILQMKFLLP